MSRLRDLGQRIDLTVDVAYIEAWDDLKSQERLTFHLVDGGKCILYSFRSPCWSTTPGIPVLSCGWVCYEIDINLHGREGGNRLVSFKRPVALMEVS